MSILNEENKLAPSPNEVAAEKLRQMTKFTFKLIVDSFNTGSKTFWAYQNGTTPSGIAESLGSDASEVFYLHARLGELIAIVKPEAIAEGLSVVGEFTQNQDGTITVVPPPSGE
jgi:hypothetical protein